MEIEMSFQICETQVSPKVTWTEEEVVFIQGLGSSDRQKKTMTNTAGTKI